jgi:hypothetical protein
MEINHSGIELKVLEPSERKVRDSGQTKNNPQIK